MNLKAYVSTVLLSSLIAFGIGEMSRSHIASADQLTPLVQTQKIEILDVKGKVRMTLGSSPSSGAAGIGIFDASSKNARVAIGVFENGTVSIELKDPNGSNRASLDLTSDGFARLVLVDSNQQRSEVLGIDGRSALVFNDENKITRAAIGLTPSTNLL